VSFKFRPTADQARTAIEKGKGRREKRGEESSRI
jgi:hypothetical protein